MKSSSHNRQLVLFPGEQIAWESLTEESQQSLYPLLSLLIEQVHDQQRSQHKLANLSSEENHV